MTLFCGQDGLRPARIAWVNSAERDPRGKAGPRNAPWRGNCRGELAFRKLGINSHNVRLYSVGLAGRMRSATVRNEPGRKSRRHDNRTEYKHTLCELTPSLRNDNLPSAIAVPGSHSVGQPFRAGPFPQS